MNNRLTSCKFVSRFCVVQRVVVLVIGSWVARHGWGWGGFGGNESKAEPADGPHCRNPDWIAGAPTPADVGPWQRIAPGLYAIYIIFYDCFCAISRGNRLW